jgi:hypothetical protein
MEEEDVAMPDEVQLQELRDELAAAHTEAARLATELAAATDAAAAFEADTASMGAMLEDAAERERAAAERYRDLVVRSEPALPPDLIRGETIDAVDASVAEAREIAGRVRAHIEDQAKAARVPPGAPARAAPDISAMTPREKIRYGLAQRERAT